MGKTIRFNLKKINEKYDWSESIYNKFDSIYFGLSTVKFSNYKTQIQVSLPGQTLNLFSLDNINFQGTLVNFTCEYISEKNKGSGYNENKRLQYVFQKIKLDSALSTKAALQILSTRQDTISQDAVNKAWNNNFFDCDGLLFEFNYNQAYKLQVFPCLFGQNDTILFKKIVYANYDFISKEFSFKEKYDAFESILPRGKTYSKDGFTMMYVWTDKEKKTWQKYKPNYEYMESVKDTLNKYLSDTLSKIFKAEGKVNCYNEFFLRFSKKNKLKKITTNEKFSDLADRIQYHICKRKIRKAFKKIRVDFIKPKRGYLKELYLSEVYGVTIS